MKDNSSKLYMILEKSSHNLDVTRDGDDIVLQGIFAQFGVVNNNERIYEEQEYLPHLEYLNKKIIGNRLLGELDHPEKFDISLSKVSHLIENLEYDKQKRQIVGRVRLLDTPSGRIAKDLVKAGVPISISSRAAGLVESNKKVKIKKIFTYDLVADPGFENAVLNRINESLGIHNELISIFDIGESPEMIEETTKTEPKNNQEHTMVSSVTPDELHAYSLIVKEEIEKIHARLETLNETKEETELVTKVNELSKTVEKMEKYLDYLATTTDKSIAYSENLAEKLDQVIGFTNYVAKTLDESIQYSEKVAEKVDQSIQYGEYLKEQIEKGISYSEYLKECLENAVDYSEMIAEKVDQNIQYSEMVAEKTDQSIRYSEKLSEKLTQTISYAEYLKEGLEKGISYTEYVAEQAQSIADYTEFAINEAKKAAPSQAVNEQTEEVPAIQSYESLPSKVDELIESIKKQKIEESNQKHFGVMMLLNEARRSEFRQMDESTKQKVLVALNNSDVKTEEDAQRIWESVLTPHIEKWVEEAPSEYKQIWESLDETARRTLIAQSKTYKLENAYQIKNFWETRPANLLKKISTTQSLNENVKVEAPLSNNLGYSKEYIEKMGALLDKYKN